jgi:hypothetical protein
MPSVRLEIEVPEGLAEALAVECERLGFDSPAAYVRWLIDHRDTVETGAERRHGSEEKTNCADAETETENATAGLADTTRRSGRVRVLDGDDGVVRAAAELGGVEDDRLDEVTRRAVARTRDRLGDVDTGLNYDSQTVVDDTALPGADLADLDALDLPGRDEDLIERRRRAVGAAVVFLEDVGEARRKEFVDALYREYPAGYESEAGWWNCLKRGLKQVHRVDGADAGSRTWRYRDYRGRVYVASED